MFRMYFTVLSAFFRLRRVSGAWNDLENNAMAAMKSLVEKFKARRFDGYQSFATAHWLISELSAEQNLFSDFISDSILRQLIDCPH